METSGGGASESRQVQSANLEIEYEESLYVDVVDLGRIA